MISNRLSLTFYTFLGALAASLAGILALFFYLSYDPVSGFVVFVPGMDGTTQSVQVNVQATGPRSATASRVSTPAW